MGYTPTVVFDFDGVVHSYKSGWKGETVIPDPVVPGIADEIARFRRFGYRVVVVSTRCATEEGLAAVKKYLRENQIEVDAVQKEKPPALCYIDDRALCFRGNPRGLVEKVAHFKTWTERDPLWDEGVKNLRLCKAERWENGKVVKVYGHFHGWASTYEELQDGVGNYTYALVEDKSGRVFACIDTSIEFLDRTGEAPEEYAEWIIPQDKFTPYRRCNKCGWEMPLIANDWGPDRVKFPHCPGCGLPMKGEL